MMIFFIFANFSKSRKNWRFSQPRPCRPFSLISHLCPVEKVEDFPHPSPGDPFPLFHTCAQISSKWVNFYILVVLMSNYDDFLHFRKLFEKSKKLKIFPTPALGTLWIFPYFTLVPRFYPNEWILVKWWWFSSFSQTFEKSKKLKIFSTPALGILFSYFTLVPRFHPNEWIFIS